MEGALENLVNADRWTPTIFSLNLYLPIALVEIMKLWGFIFLSNAGNIIVQRLRLDTISRL